MGERRGQEGDNRGTNTISDTVVSKIAGIAAQEVEKIQMGGGRAAAVTGFLGSITGGGASGGANLTSGVSVEVGAEEAAVDLTLAVEYGIPIPQATQAVRRNVINRVENLTGLRVTEVTITVNDVQFPEERPQLEEQKQVERTAKEQERQTQ
jgi:uncharacterized alkaline shock family protein YloU